MTALRRFRGCQLFARLAILCVSCLVLQCSNAPAVELQAEPEQRCTTSAFSDQRELTSGGEWRLHVPGDENALAPGVEVDASLSTGSAVAATSVTLRDIQTGRRIEASFVVAFDRMLTRHRAIPDLAGQNQSWRTALEHAAFSRVCERADPSLQWLLEPAARPVWIRGNPRMPENYVLRRVDERTGSVEWTEYLGWNHRRLTDAKISDQFEVLDQQPPLQLLRSGHGAVLRDTERDAYAWIYVFPGGHKLRWPSVVGGTFESNTVVLELANGVSATNRERLVIDLVCFESHSSTR